MEILQKDEANLLNETLLNQIERDLAGMMAQDQ
jgi:hypothetical protein